MPNPGCVYGQFDPRSLTPTTPETEYRVRQLGWTRDEFEGRSVLDIGCNRGVLSVVAAQLGATSVQAVDPNQEFLDAIAEIAAIHRRLNITLRRGMLKDLDPETE